MGKPTTEKIPGKNLQTHIVDKQADLRIANGIVAEIGKGLAPAKGERVIEADGLVVCPGFIDLHVHFREPGFEYKEDIASGARAAVAGGFTTVCCMPNTSPVNDCSAVTELITRRSAEVGLAKVLPIGAITKGLLGKQLAEFGNMKASGIVAVSDDGRPVMDAGVMRRALEYAATFGLPVVQHAEDLSLSCGAPMNEGSASLQMGVSGQPSQAEIVMVARDIELVTLTGARYHVAHLSAKRSAEIVRDAKRRGLPVTAEVTPHHFMLTDVACGDYDTNTKVMPPLRQQSDVDALREAMVDGTIDCIATDHAPHGAVDKHVDFGCAAPGMLGLETALGLTLELVRENILSLPRAIELLTSGPAKVFGFDSHGAGSLQQGRSADICIFDPNKQWTVSAKNNHSKSFNTPFAGRAMQGQCVATFVAGRQVYGE